MTYLIFGYFAVLFIGVIAATSLAESRDSQLYVNLDTGYEYEFIKKVNVKHPETGVLYSAIECRSTYSSLYYVYNQEYFDKHFRKKY